MRTRVSHGPFRAGIMIQNLCRRVRPRWSSPSPQKAGWVRRCLGRSRWPRRRGIPHRRRQKRNTLSSRMNVTGSDRSDSLSRPTERPDPSFRRTRGGLSRPGSPGGRRPIFWRNECNSWAMCLFPRSLKWESTVKRMPASPC